MQAVEVCIFSVLGRTPSSLSFVWKKVLERGSVVDERGPSPSPPHKVTSPYELENRNTETWLTLREEEQQSQENVGLYHKLKSISLSGALLQVLRDIVPTSLPPSFGDLFSSVVVRARVSMSFREPKGRSSTFPMYTPSLRRLPNYFRPVPL